MLSVYSKLVVHVRADSNRALFDSNGKMWREDRRNSHHNEKDNSFKHNVGQTRETHRRLHEIYGIWDVLVNRQ